MWYRLGMLPFKGKPASDAEIEDALASGEASPEDRQEAKRLIYSMRTKALVAISQAQVDLLLAHRFEKAWERGEAAAAERGAR